MSDLIDLVDETQTEIPARVLRAAASVFQRHGYAAATIREIAEALGLQKASLYHHIEGKEQLLYAICVESLRKKHTAVALAVAAGADPEDRLRAAIRAHVATMLADQPLHATTLTELRSLSGEQRDRVVALRDQYEQMLRVIVTECQNTGFIRDDIDVKYQVLSLLNLLNWTIFWYREDDGLSAQQLADLFTTLFIEGAGAPTVTG